MSENERITTIEELAVLVQQSFADVTSRMATKDDLAALRNELHEAKRELKAGIADLKQDASTRIEALEGVKKDHELRISRLEEQPR